MKPQILILGIGNPLLSDEGVGVHAIKYLENNFGQNENIQLVDGGTLSFILADIIQQSSHLIIIDAAQLSANPGTLQCFAGEQMDQFLGQCKRNVHDIGLLDLMDICRLNESLPVYRAMVAVQPESIDWGEELSRAVAAQLPEISKHISRLLEQWNI